MNGDRVEGGRQIDIGISQGTHRADLTDRGDVRVNRHQAGNASLGQILKNDIRFSKSSLDALRSFNIVDHDRDGPFPHRILIQIIHPGKGIERIFTLRFGCGGALSLRGQGLRLTSGVGWVELATGDTERHYQRQRGGYQAMFHKRDAPYY